MTWILKERYRDLHKGTIVAIIRIPTPLSKDSDRGKTLKNPQKLLKFVLVMIPKSSKILPIILPTIDTKPVVNYFYWTNYRTLSVDHDFNIKYVEWFGMIPKKVFVLSHLENNKKGTKPHYRLGLVPLKWFFFGDRKTCICLTWRNQFRQNKINSLEITEFHFFKLYRVLLEI